MKKFIAFVCVLCLALGLGVPAFAIDEEGEDGEEIIIADEVVEDEADEAEAEVASHPITVTYNFWYSENDHTVMYSTSGETQKVKEGEYFVVNGYTNSYQFDAKIPGFETMVWAIKSTHTTGTITQGLDMCYGQMGTCPVDIQFYYIPYEDVVYVEHYCDDVFVEKTQYTTRVGKQTYAMTNSYEGYTLVNELVGDIVPIRTTGVAPLTLRLDYHSPNYQPSKPTPEPEPTEEPIEEEPTPEPEEPTPTPDPIEEEEPVVTPEPIIPPIAGEVEEKEEPTPAPTATNEPIAIQVNNTPAETVAPQKASVPTAGWSIVSLFLALGCLGFGYALFRENKMRYDGIIIGVLAFMMFIMSVQSWAVMIIADTTTWLLAGVFAISMLNYWLHDKEVRF